MFLLQFSANYYVMLESVPSLCSYIVLCIIIDHHVSVSDFKFLLDRAS